MAVKADGYGHGALRMAATALEEGVSALGVATVEEGIELRQAKLRASVILLGLPLPEELPDIVAHDITPFVTDAATIGLLAAEAKKQRKRTAVHLKVDTGMGRIGCRPDEVLPLAAQIHESSSLFLEGLATHFPTADSADSAFTLRQIAILNEIAATLSKNKIKVEIVHAANSGALIDKPAGFFTMARPGIILYGYYPSADQKRIISVKPVMEFRTKVDFIKKAPSHTGISYGLTYTTKTETYIATLPVGYGDGYSRLLSNRGEVSIGGKRYPVCGRVCMDQTMIDLGPAHTVKLYDEVTLFGGIPGGPDAEEIAGLMGTIPYEVTCLITKRVPRVYLDEKKEE
jgi:alanine racemase